MFWWIFWIIMIVLFLGLLMLSQRRKTQAYRETPLEVFQRRYAAGEISTEEYEERKAHLERDRGSA
jgi:putative membrane protein